MQIWTHSPKLARLLRLILKAINLKSISSPLSIIHQWNYYVILNILTLSQPIRALITVHFINICSYHNKTNQCFIQIGTKGESQWWTASRDGGIGVFKTNSKGSQHIYIIFLFESSKFIFLFFNNYSTKNKNYKQTWMQQHSPNSL